MRNTPTPPFSMMPAAARPVEQRELGVPAFDRQRRLEAKLVTLVRGHDLLPGNAEARAASCTLGTLQQPSRSRGAAPASRRPSRRRSPAAPARTRASPDSRPSRARRGHRRGTAAVVDVDRPDDRRTRHRREAATLPPPRAPAGRAATAMSGLYAVSPRRCASASTAPPGSTNAATSAIAYRSRKPPPPSRSRCSAWSRSSEVGGSIVTNGTSVRSRRDRGVRGSATERSASASTSGGKVSGMPISARISENASRSPSPGGVSRTDRLGIDRGYGRGTASPVLWTRDGLSRG